MSKLYKRQNIPIENYPEGILVEYRDGFGIAMNYSDKTCSMTLPCDIQILIGNKTKNCLCVVLEMLIADKNCTVKHAILLRYK